MCMYALCKMILCFVLLLYASTALGIGYDSGGGERATCGRPYRAGRLYQPPCDLARLGFCSHAGQLYPWRAVRRFVKDNQGLMRRMYGDQRHGHVLRFELEEGEEGDSGDEWEPGEKRRFERWRPEAVRFSRYHDDIDNDLNDEDLDLDLIDNPYSGEPRYLRGDLTNDDVLNTKFVYSKQEAAIAIKLAELKAAAHFRPTTQRPTSSTPKTPRSTTEQTTSTTSIPNSNFTQTTISSGITTTKNSSTSKPNKESTIHEVKTKVKIGTTKGTSEVPSFHTTDSSLATSTIPEDFLEQSTADITTQRSQDWPTNILFTTTEKSMVKNITASDRLGEASKHEESIGAYDKSSEILESFEEKDKNSDKNDNSYDIDNTNKGNDNSESDSDGESGDLKAAETGDTPAVLFQDMEEDESTKKKVQVNYNQMKGVNACPVKEEVVAPFWANNTRGEVLALLNMYPFEQYVHWEKCTFEHRQMYCREGCRCEQQYRLHRLLAYDPSNECRGIFSDWFRFPSCCICKCYDMPPEFRVTSRSPRFQVPYPEEE